MFAIEKNHPAPNKFSVTELMRQMEIGDSFVSNKQQMHAQAKAVGIKVTVRKEAGGYRVWRIA